MSVVDERRLHREPAVFKTTVARVNAESLVLVTVGPALLPEAEPGRRPHATGGQRQLGADDDARPSHFSKPYIRVGAHGGPPWLGSQPWAERALRDDGVQKPSPPVYDRISQ